MEKDTTTRTLRVLLDADTGSAVKNRGIEQWENEGGAAIANKPVWSADAPLRKGEIFEVKEIEVLYKDKEAYCLIEIELLSR